MEMEKSKHCNSKHIIASVLIMLIVGLFFGLLGYLLGSKNNSAVINNSTKNAEVNQNIENNKSKNLEAEKIDWETYSSKENDFEFMLPKEYVFSGVVYNGDKGGMGDALNSDEEIKFEPVGSSTEYIEGDDKILYWNVKDGKNDIMFKMIKQFRAKAGAGTLSEIAMNYPTPKDKITNITLVELNFDNAEIIKQKFDISDPLLQSGSWYYVASDEILYVFIADENADENAIEEILSTFKFTDLKDETADWQIYINDEYKYTVKYPEEFSTKEWAGIIKNETHSGVNDALLSLVGFGKNLQLGDSQVSITVSSKTLEQEKELIKVTIADAWKNEKDISINGIKSVEYVGTGGEGATGKVIAILVPKTNQTYKIIYTEVNDKTDRLVMFNQMLSTFRFTDSNDEIVDWQTYTNEKYGFEVTLLDSWKGYSILTETWSGTTLDGKSTQYQGPQVIIRNPKWSANQSWQDIPVMVFTKEEWTLIEAQNLNVSAAPVGPNKLDENQKYVFALPPRWTGFTDALGQNEAQEIAKTIRAIQF